jgi:hypothetical protein
MTVPEVFGRAEILGPAHNLITPMGSSLSEDRKVSTPAGNKTRPAFVEETTKHNNSEFTTFNYSY